MAPDVLLENDQTVKSDSDEWFCDSGALWVTAWFESQYGGT